MKAQCLNLVQIFQASFNLNKVIAFQRKHLTSTKNRQHSKIPCSRGQARGTLFFCSDTHLHLELYKSLHFLQNLYAYFCRKIVELSTFANYSLFVALYKNTRVTADLYAKFCSFKTLLLKIEELNFIFGFFGKSYINTYLGFLENWIIFQTSISNRSTQKMKILVYFVLNLTSLKFLVTTFFIRSVFKKLKA